MAKFRLIKSIKNWSFKFPIALVALTLGSYQASTAFIETAYAQNTSPPSFNESEFEQSRNIDPVADTSPAPSSIDDAPVVAPNNTRTPTAPNRISGNVNTANATSGGQNQPLPTNKPAPASNYIDSDDADISYFDSENVPDKPSPNDSVQTNFNTRISDPKTDPMAKFVVVKKDYQRDSVASIVEASKKAINMGMYDSAIQMLEPLRAKNIKNPRVLMGLAVAYQKTGKEDLSVEIYKEILELHPDNVEAQVNMLGMMHKKYPEFVVSSLEKLHQEQPSNPIIVAQIGMIAAELGDYKKSMKYLGLAASLEPNNPLHYYNLAIIADRNGKISDAISLYEKALEIDAIHGMGKSIPRTAVYDRLAVIKG